MRAAVIHIVRGQLLAFPNNTAVVTGTYCSRASLRPCRPPCDMYASADDRDRVKDIRSVAHWRPSLRSLSCSSKERTSGNMGQTK